MKRVTIGVGQAMLVLPSFTTLRQRVELHNVDNDVWERAHAFDPLDDAVEAGNRAGKWA